MGPVNVTITKELVAEHGLTTDEYARIEAIMARAPNLTELGIFSVMWSEHCSYKSSRKWLKTLPTDAPWVICGPGENAGVIDIGEGKAVIFKMESHNHPSFIEPYQGAATGVGGILRDVFTMGARPIANLNALRFGSPDHPKTRHLVSGVVAGIGGYGNCVGVPTVGGETNFDPSYNGNILVNAMTVGLADTNRIFYSKAAGIGNQVVYVGSKTGRDGIHGATMASAEFTDDSEEKRPTVQVGDPFTEKLLIEACMELMATDAIVAIQDMGAAGLTSSSVEMCDKGGLGMRLDIDSVPVREQAMTAYEIMLSESQERMLMILHPGREDVARAVFEKWGLDFAVIGELTDSGKLELVERGDIVADIPITPLVDEAPEYDRPWVRTTPPSTSPGAPDIDPGEALKKMMASPALCSRRWIWDQYDHMVMGDTVARPGGDAAIVRVHGTKRGVAVAADCTPRYCAADPVMGGMQVIAEAWRNLTAVGATPRAVTDNLNFGNPERPEIMGQLVGCIEGMGEACRALDFPVVSGNVSLYNETNGEGILPTPVIGSVGLLEDISTAVNIGFAAAGQDIVLIGSSARDSGGHLGCSLLVEICGAGRAGPPPPVDLGVERRNGDFVRNEITSGKVAACHDISDGGLLVALAEMALAGNIGAALEIEPSKAGLGWLFGEDQGRYLITTDDTTLLQRAADADVPAMRIGTTAGSGTAASLTLPGTDPISLKELSTLHEGWFPDYMEDA